MNTASKRSGRRALMFLVFVAAFVACFLYYDVSNDHYDRLTRARQIVMYGDVPFRDFFDPGYFLTLYTSALSFRIFGENLVGEVLVNLVCIALGVTIVFAIASGLTRSIVWGFFAALLVVVSEPRPYDYDKIIFYPLGLVACWHYCERPTTRALLALSAVIAVSGLFRYDNSVYIGAAALVAIVARHWRDWAGIGRRLVAISALVLFFASPALVYIQATAGLGTAVRQVTTYARVEGARTKVFEPAAFRFNWHAPLVGRPSPEGGVGLAERLGWLPGIWTKNNAAAWLYWTAAALSVVALLLPLSARNRERQRVAKALSLSVMLALVTAFILRDPIAARVANVMPLLAIGGAWLLAEWRRAHEGAARAEFGWTRRLPAALGSVLVVITVLAVVALLWIPTRPNFDLVTRSRLFATTPTDTSLLPKGELEPLVKYLVACTTPSDRVVVTWFAPEMLFFSRRGFGAGLPVVFGRHWNELPYQRRSLELLERQSVPVIISDASPPFGGYDFLSEYALRNYDLALNGRLDVSPRVAIWTRKDRRAIRMYPGSTLPCFA